MSTSQVIDHQANETLTRFSVFCVSAHPALFQGEEELAGIACYQEGQTKLISGEKKAIPKLQLSHMSLET